MNPFFSNSMAKLSPLMSKIAVLLSHPLFILHEMRVHGFHSFEPIEPAMLNDYPWQDWILSDGVFDNASGSFKRDGPLGNEDNGNNISAQSLPQFQLTTMSAGDTSSGGRRLALNADIIADILAVTRESRSWKACQIEGTSWAGTAEENIEEYISSIGMRQPEAEHKWSQGLDDGSEEKEEKKDREGRSGEQGDKDAGDRR